MRNSREGRALREIGSRRVRDYRDVPGTGLAGLVKLRRRGVILVRTGSRIGILLMLSLA